jgi:hypothetical protein
MVRFEARDCRVTFQSAAGTLAVATIGRDLDTCVLSWDWRPQGPFHDAPFEL